MRIPALKGHRVLPIDTATDSVVDRLVYCSAHQDKTIELNCKQCELSICILCHVVNHNGHETETIDDALERRLLPKLNENSEQVKHNIKDIQAQIEGLDQQTKVTEQNFKQCQNDINKEYDELIQKLTQIKKKQLHKVKEQKLKSLKSIVDLKTPLQNKLRNCENLINLVETCTVKAKHATLLREIQSGLYTNTMRQSEDKQGVIEVKGISPVFEKTPEYPSVEKLTSLVGDINFKETVFKLKSGKIVCTEGQNAQKKVQCFDKVLNQPWKQCKTNKLDGWCNRISQINDNIIICLYKKMETKSISTKTCDIQTFKTNHKFIVIRQAHNQTLVGAGEDGLYVTSDKEITADNNWIKLQEGRYSDICVHDNRFSVLECDTHKVVTYELTKGKGQWVQQGVIQVQDISGWNRAATLLYYKGTFIITGW